MKGPAVTLTDGHYEFRIPTGGGSFSPIRLRPGGVANAVGGAFREFSGSGSANRVARPNRLSPRVTPDPAVPLVGSPVWTKSTPGNNRLESGGRNEHWDHTRKHRR